MDVEELRPRLLYGLVISGYGFYIVVLFSEQAGYVVSSGGVLYPADSEAAEFRYVFTGPLVFDEDFLFGIEDVASVGGLAEEY